MIFEYGKDDVVRCKKFRKGISQTNIYNGSEYHIESVWVIQEKKANNPPRGIIRINGVGFRIEEFYDYFYTKKEIRQLKLNKIDKNV